jgi:hypothetical protein
MQIFRRRNQAVPFWPAGFVLSVCGDIKGGPAMSAREYESWHQKTILGVSLKVVAPTGQYDPTKLINNGSNRWAFNPEFGYSERWGLGWSMPTEGHGFSPRILLLV